MITTPICTASGLVNFDEAVRLLAAAISKLEDARLRIVAAGCGSFSTVKDRETLLKSDRQLRRMLEQWEVKSNLAHTSKPSTLAA